MLFFLTYFLLVLFRKILVSSRLTLSGRGGGGVAFLFFKVITV